MACFRQCDSTATGEIKCVVCLARQLSRERTHPGQRRPSRVSESLGGPPGARDKARSSVPLRRCGLQRPSRDVPSASSRSRSRASKTAPAPSIRSSCARSTSTERHPLTRASAPFTPWPLPSHGPSRTDRSVLDSRGLLLVWLGRRHSLSGSNEGPPYDACFGDSFWRSSTSGSPAFVVFAFPCCTISLASSF